MLAETRQAIANALIAGVADVQWSAYALSNPTAPYGHVLPSDLIYDQAMGRGMDEWTYTLVALVADAPGDIGMQMLLDQLLEPSGARSVKAALEASVTLGGLVDSIHVPECSGYRIYQTEGRAPQLGAEWTIKVLAPGG